MAGLLEPLPLTGVPLGGIGTGGIMRASDGRFARWTLKAGAVSAFDMAANGFLLRVARDGVAPQARASQPAPQARASQPAPQARASQPAPQARASQPAPQARASQPAPQACALQPAPQDGTLAAFAFEPQAPEWAALFPLAWSRHAPLFGVRAEAVAFSPVIPGDWAAATLPAAVVRWRLTNTGDTPAEVSLAFTFANLNGWFAAPEEGRPARPAAGAFNAPLECPGGIGVVLDRRRPGGPPPEGTGQWAIALTAPEGATLSRTTCFDGTGDGAAFWDGFAATGDAPDLGPGWVVEGGFRGMVPAHPAAAVCARVTLAPGESREVRAALAWDLPVIGFGQGRRWFRAHTDAGGGTAAPRGASPPTRWRRARTGRRASPAGTPRLAPIWAMPRTWPGRRSTRAISWWTG